MGVSQGIAEGALLVMAMSVLAVAGSSSMQWLSRPRAQRRQHGEAFHRCNSQHYRRHEQHTRVEERCHWSTL